MSGPSLSYMRDLLRIRETISPALTELLEHWPSVLQAVDRQRRRITSNIPKQDPLRDGIDLLSPLGRAFDETTHTQALAYLLDPERPHGFETDLLIALLERCGQGGTGRVVRALKHALVTVRVRAEYRRSGRDLLAGPQARCDLWIEITTADRHFLVLIENKIDAAEGKEQLLRYALQADAWCARNAGGERHLLYLTKRLRPLSDAAREAGWKNLSYLDAAACFRMAWLERRGAPGRSWLGWYIATLAKTAVGLTMEQVNQVPLSSRPGAVEIHRSIDAQDLIRLVQARFRCTWIGAIGSVAGDPHG